MSTPDGVSPAAFGWARAAAAGLSFRPITAVDLPFLFAVYASTRAEELAPVPWTDTQKTAFLTQQFNAQHTDYQHNYVRAEWLVVMRAGTSVGRLYIDRNAREHSVIDIALLPEHRGHGIGGAIMRDLMDEAQAAGKPLTIYVEKYNPALRLYRRLGFQTVEDKGVYDLMRWSAQDASR
jgi:ribosomal protein S18 acetylase RimI-like enzyme